jgi:selenoprotein W-related protein
LEKFESEIETLALIPSDEGRFEVEVNGQLVYSKLKTKRHAEPGEVAGLIKNIVEKK